MSFLIGLSIPLIIVIIFWKDLRVRRERIINFIKTRFSRN